MQCRTGLLQWHEGERILFAFRVLHTPYAEHDLEDEARMPGGRLTQEDRRRIAEGLAEGLGYAEIARRLARPTSTVSREVTRNGGADGYRADRAQHETERRARRGKHVPQAPPPFTAEMRGCDPEALRDFEESFVGAFLASGLPRMASRVLACLYLSDDGSLTSAELVRRLCVSPASVSKAVGYLEAQQLIQRERAGARRPERYAIDGDVWFRALEASARMNTALADAARKGAGVLGDATPAGARLADMSEFLDHVTGDLLRKAAYWRNEIAERRRRRADANALEEDGG